MLEQHELEKKLCDYCTLEEQLRGVKSLHANCEGSCCDIAYESYIESKEKEQKELNSISQQFDELDLSIAELLYSDLECKKVYNQAIEQNIEAGIDLSVCMFNATNKVKTLVVERSKRLESEAFEYFNLGTI